MSITLERIFALIQASGKSEYAIKKETGLKNSVFSEWRAGRANPSTDAIITLAKYFGVTTDYLLGLSERDQSLLNKENKQAVKEPFATTPHIVAHIDILGTKAMVANKESNQKLLDTMIVAIDKWKNDIPKFNEMQCVAQKLSFKIFSDNIVLYIPFEKEHYAELLRTMCECSIYIQRTLLLNKDFPLPVRGGIAIENFYADEDFVYGQALIDSYLIEENLAIVPRIVISEAIIDTLYNKNILSQFAGYGKLIIDDFDGFYYLNFLYEQGKDEVMQIKSFIGDVRMKLKSKHNEQILEKMKGGKNEVKDYTKLYQKYGWLLRYTCNYYKWLEESQAQQIIEHIEKQFQSTNQEQNKKVLAAEFAKTYEDLIQDENFRKTAQLYNSYDSFIRGLILGAMVNWLNDEIKNKRLKCKHPSEIIDY